MCIRDSDGISKSRVNLVLLYAEVDGDIEFESGTSAKKTDWRIVKTSSPVKVSEDEFRYAYDLFNPNTGKVDEKVYGTTSKSSADSLASVEPLSLIHISLMSNPKIILMDEPSMGLSPLLVNEIFHIIREVSADGTTVLLVEQNAKKALSIADRAYVLETGKISLSGKASDLINDEQVKKAYLGE